MKRISIILTAIFFWACFQFSYLDLFSQTTGYSGTGANIDVKHHRFVWSLDPAAGKTITGNVTTYFETKQNNVSQITFDFNKASFNNLNLIVNYHGSAVGVTFSFPTTGNVNILRINLPVTLPINTIDSISIAYSGTPPNFATFGEGMDRKTAAQIPGLGPTVYTLAESYGDDDFWPCKADMQDKIDSVTYIITTPLAYRSAANGLLVNEVTTATTRTMTYKHKYPIASYLVAVAAAQYTIYTRTPVNINGTNVPIDYYIGSGRTPTAGNLATMDRCRDELVAFSNVFGDYPFKNEKYGMYEFGWGGGMEHQTFSAMSWGSMTSWSVIAHELAHQWFGDKVTFGTWNHLWLAEGFARYSEALAAELVPALGQNPSTVRSSFKTSANGATLNTYSCYIPNSSIVDANAIWNSAYGNTVYERGAMVVSMLRMLLGDAKFYQACRNYLNDPALAYRSATTDDLRNHMQAVAGGYDLTPFFNSYVYGNGYPSYNTAIRWGNPGNNRISFKVTTQTKSTGSTVAYYHTPIAIRVQGSLPSQDTVLVIYDQNGQLSKGGNGISTPTAGNYIYFMLGFNPVTVTFDPLNQTLVTGAVPVFDNADPLLTFTTLDLKIVDFTLKQNTYSNELNLNLSDTEEELQSVVLQKSSTANDFEDAGIMNQVGVTSNITKHFLFTDNMPFAEGTYYRAKITDKKGQVKYTEIVNAKGTMQKKLSVYPNPAAKNVTIRWNGIANCSSEVILYNTEGKKVLTRTSESNSINILIPNLNAGVYSVVVKQKGKTVLTDQLIITK